MSLSASKMFTVRQKLFIPVTQFSGFTDKFVVQSSGSIGTDMEVGFSHNTDAGTFEGGTGITAERKIVGASAPNRRVSAGVGGGILREISAGGISGLLMATAGDDIRHFMEIPQDWDRSQKVRVRIIYSTASTTAADTITWKFAYRLITPGTTDFGATSVVLDTLLAADNVSGTADAIERSAAAGVINAKSLGIAALYWLFGVEMDAFAAGLTEGKTLLGVEFEYTKRTGYGHAVGEAKAWRA